ncbi:MAG: fatty acid/phospholipid synthesis protein PlsX [Myxococcales bacterium]|nr:fatty acid/phospholipid synthesis protein PlsX [Myxococcales bacterium]
MRTVAVDAMGGDHAPGPEVEGAVAAVRERIARVVLVGDQERVTEELRRHDAVGLEGLSVKHASEVIRMEDHPAVAAKGKKDSSMRVAFDLAKEGSVDAVISAGNSGAMLACGLFVMRRLRGVERPGIVTTFPTQSGVCALIDMGANVDCRPETLAQFAVLGAVYARLLHGKARPKVGLLSNGEEAIKGTDLTRGAYKLLTSPEVDKDFEFVGYVEGRDIFGGDVDVVVTDGFTGNIVLKTSEGAAAAIGAIIKRELLSTVMGKLGALMLRGAFKRLKRVLDVDEHGGAPLIGVNGIAVLTHGAASGRAFKNGIRVAASFVESGLTDAVSQAIAKHAALWSDAAVQASSG